MNLQSAYREKMNAQIEELAAEMALARARARRLVAEGRIAAAEELAETESKLNTLKERLAAAATAGDEAWQDLRQGLDAAWSEVQQAAARARSRFG